jgi:hypothetical protein
MLIYLGINILVSAPHGIKFAPRLDAKMDSIMPRLTSAIAARAPECQFLVRIKLQRSHGFQTKTPHELWMDEVAKIPRVALKVFPTTSAISCDRMGAEGVLAYRARSGYKKLSASHGCTKLGMTYLVDDQRCCLSHARVNCGEHPPGKSCAGQGCRTCE